MRTLSSLLVLLLFVHLARAQSEQDDATTVTMSKQELRDKIMGGWAAQTIGVTFGGPTEFRYNGAMIHDYEPIPWYDGYLAWWYDNAPGLYDDLYMDLTFVDVIERYSADAPADTFAKAFATADYQLWHANQQARYNYLNGLRPPETGHWRNNPEADDIDFQIESDFAGLMHPGLPQSAARMCDKVGHIMNSGDGYYGGVFVATMYSLAFVMDEVGEVVRTALTAIPEESTFHQTIRDVIAWHEAYPDDWKRTWLELQRKWGNDIGCPHGVFAAFNIDAKMNAAYVVLGLLYGEGDFTRTIEITTRAGDDSDCNPATAVGILATMRGYEWIPEFWKQGLDEVVDRDFAHTTISLSKAYELSFKHALAAIEESGGTVGADEVVIPLQPVQTVPLEQNFVGHYPVDEIGLNARVEDEITFDFDGIGFTISGHVESTDGSDHVLKAELYIDGELTETVNLPTAERARRFIPFFRYELQDGEHAVRIRLINSDVPASLYLDRAIVYASAPHSGIR